MVGRDRDLSRLSDLIGMAGTHVALVAGEPGIGKTRLARELVEGVTPTTVTLIGHSDPSGSGRPFEMFLDAVGDLPDTSLPETGDRLQAATDIVRRLTTPGPAVLIFEDLHWADPDSVALFERVAELTGGSRLLVGTYRPDEVTRRHPLADTMTRLDRRHEVIHLRLERLGLGETTSFLAAVSGRAPSRRAVTTLHRRTGGNPFFLEELLKAGGRDDIESLCDEPLPWSLAEALRRQLDDLDPTARRIIEVAAVLGRKVRFDILAAVSGTGEDELIRVMRDLVRQGLMDEVGEDIFVFRHALTREAISEELLGRQRRRIHEAALEVLLSSDDDLPGLIAEHAKGAGRYDDMVAAARRGSAKYLAGGSAHMALQLAELGLEEEPDDVPLRSNAARAAWLAGLLGDANQHARRWLASAGAETAREQRSAALRLMTRIAWDGNDLAAVEDLTRQLHTVFDELPMGEERARVAAAVAQSHMLNEHQAETVEWADRAIALAEELNLPDVRLAARVEKGSALTKDVETAEEGARLLRAVADEAERAGEWLLVARAINNFVFNAVGGVPDMPELLERLGRAAERAGWVSGYEQSRARLAIYRGHLDGALAALAEATKLDGKGGKGGKGFYGAFEAGLAMEKGDLDRAEQLLAEGRLSLDKDGIAVVGLAFHIAARRGQRAIAAAMVPTMLPTLLAELVGPDTVHNLVSAALHVGLPDAAHEIADVPGSRGAAPNAGNAWRRLIEAQLAEADGHTDRALAAYTLVIEATALPAANRGTAHVGAGRAQLALGNADAARRHLAAAERLLERWGGWRLDEVAALRDRLAAPATDRALTRREQDVAELVADGLTNAELARRLHISPKTAAVHVSNILGKLQMSSRAQIAAWVRSRG